MTLLQSGLLSCGVGFGLVLLLAVGWWIRLSGFPWGIIRLSLGRMDRQPRTPREERPLSPEDEARKARERLLASLMDSVCPDCTQNVLFLEGPRGGMSQNIKCPDCGATYNWCPGFFAERI